MNQEELDELLDMRSRLDHDLQCLHTALLAASQETEDGSVNDLRTRVAALQSELHKESTARSWKELCLKRSEMGKLAHDKVFFDDKDAIHDQIVQYNLEQCDTAETGLRIKQEISDLKTELNETNLKNFGVRAENVDLMRKLKEIQAKQRLPPHVTRTAEYKELKSKLTGNTKLTALFKNLIHKLVIGNGVNLNTDEQLQALVERCCEPC